MKTIEQMSLFLSFYLPPTSATPKSHDPEIVTSEPVALPAKHVDSPNAIMRQGKQLPDPQAGVLILALQFPGCFRRGLSPISKNWSFVLGTDTATCRQSVPMASCGTRNHSNIVSTAQ